MLKAISLVELSIISGNQGTVPIKAAEVIFIHSSAFSEAQNEIENLTLKD